ncbi:MAG: hypothetical protein MJ082_04895 [Clostridia bacterium]|nr:hypothetical protein [Clostridia bacterium]
MKTGSVESLFSAFGNERYLKMKEYGFDGVDYSLESGFLNRTDEEFEAKVLADKALIDAAGLTVHQVHGPWIWPPHNETEEERFAAFRETVRKLNE